MLTGELAYFGCLVATEYKREQGYLLLLTSENRQCHKQAPEGARDQDLLKDPQSSLVEKLYTQAQGSLILPKKVSEAPSISS